MRTFLLAAAAAALSLSAGATQAAVTAIESYSEVTSVIQVWKESEVNTVNDEALDFDFGEALTAADHVLSQALSAAATDGRGEATGDVTVLTELTFDDLASGQMRLLATSTLYADDDFRALSTMTTSMYYVFELDRASTLTLAWSGFELTSLSDFAGGDITGSGSRMVDLAPGVYNLNLKAYFNRGQWEPGESTASFDALLTFAIAETPGLVPEPATWALMIGGFGLAGAALRRRAATA
ncbi:PEPxxWA-CTERM sorting domain-containing protein [Phenylobacterium sp.]|uniref:PEPxxWA-CTERM sorting domain-containing protein n=1 Tax=Phenylobacterium sp. TaxID=1871053 RepID=UPI00301D6CB7